MNLAKMLFTERSRKNLSVRDLAELTGVCSTTITDIEKGRKTVVSDNVLERFREHGLLKSKAVDMMAIEDLIMECAMEDAPIGFCTVPVTFRVPRGLFMCGKATYVEFTGSGETFLCDSNKLARACVKKNSFEEAVRATCAANPSRETVIGLRGYNAACDDPDLRESLLTRTPGLRELVMRLRGFRA